MIATGELLRWIMTLGPKSSVAVDNGGLTLVEISQSGEQTGAYLEVGGIAIDDDEEEA